MSRARYQHPEVEKRGKRKAYWWADWHIYVTDPATGKEHRKHRYGNFGLCSKTTKAEAQRACDALVAQETGQTPRPDARLTVAQFWITVYRPTRAWAPLSAATLDSTWRKHVEPALGNIPLDALAKAHADKLLLQLAAAGAGKQLLKRAAFLCHNLAEEAAENRFLERNPLRRVKLPACQEPEETRSLTEAEAAHLLASLDGRDRLIFHILLACGLRPMEAFALRLDDWHGGRLRVDESAYKGAGAPTKNRKARLCPVPQSLAGELDQWIADERPADLLFPNQYGECCRRNVEATAILVRARELSGIADLTYRMCRTTFATLFQGDAKDASAILGHATPEFTQRVYRKAIEDRQREAVEDLDRRMGGKVVEIRKRRA